MGLALWVGGHLLFCVLSFLFGLIGNGQCQNVSRDISNVYSVG